MNSLFIDFQGEVPATVTVSNREELEDLVETNMMIANPEPLIIDARTCDIRVFPCMLQFLEHFPEELTLYVTEPVPLSVLSRFPRIEKRFVLKEASLDLFSLFRDKITASELLVVQKMNGSLQEDS